MYLLCLLFFGIVNSLNLRPIIGVLTEPYDDNEQWRTHLSANFVYWLSAAGSRVVPISFNAPSTVLEGLLQSVNGILFTGGELSLNANTQYYKTAENIWNWAINANDKDDYFPLWGTCQGFQLMSILAADGDHSIFLINKYDTENITLALNLTPEAHSSRLLGPNCPPDVLQALTKQNMTVNLHHDGIEPESYYDNTKLKQMFTLLSTNVDRKQKPFGSTIEAKGYPFYGTQWHPERNQFVWGTMAATDQSPAAIRATQYLANFFVTECRKSNHTFPSPEAEAAALIYNFNPKFTGDEDPYADELTYYFPF
jgi:gamma-glutamyl hydrolase